MRNEKQTMPAELAKALLEDGEKEAKESFEGVPSLVVAAKEDSDYGESVPANESLQRVSESSQHVVASSQPVIESSQSINASSQPVNESIQATDPSSQPVALIDANSPKQPVTSTDINPPNQPTNQSQPSPPPSPSSSNSDLFF